MNKREFFANAINDNNYDGLSLSCIDQIKQKGRESKRVIFDYLKEVESKFAIVDIDKVANSVSFGDEYEANTKQRVFMVEGSDFDSAKIYTFNIVGTIFYKNTTFNINSRFGNSFLHYMIASSEGFLELEDTGGINKDVSIAEWLMIYYFKIKLKSAFSLGMYKTYSKQSHDLNKVRGQIDINSYVSKGYFDGKVRCNYQEHSYANQINYIISLAINKIFKNRKYCTLVQDIHTIKNAFNQVEYRKQRVPIENTGVKNPFFAQYNEVYKLALSILKENFGSSGDEDFSAFLFDVSLLFEHHIRSLLKTKYRLAVKNQKDFKVPNGCSYNHIFPDIIIYHDDGTISIYDVKYKRFRGEVDRDDRFQLISYVAMYLNRFKIKECGFVYPTDSENHCMKKQELNVAGNIVPFNVVQYGICNRKTIKENNESFILYKQEQKLRDKLFLEQFTEKGIGG